MRGINEFLSRIQTDHEFYFWFRKMPQEALAGYELSTEERGALTEGGRQLWTHLGKIGQSADSIGPALGDGIEADPLAPVTWRIRTTQTWRLDVDQSASVEPQFDPEAALGRPEVRQAVAEVNAASLHYDRLAAVSALIEHLH
jgi:hypothetical protein